MRPLYAIAPLALLLAIFGPTPHEANKALTDFVNRFASHGARPQLDNSADARTNKASVMAGELVKTSFSR